MRGAIVGAGYFAGFQAEAWTRIPGAEIVAVVDPLADRARAFSDKYRFPRTYPDVASLFEKEKLDFVDIATRPEAHLELTRLAAKNRVNVICQKPMAPTWDDCAAMVRACKEAGVRLLIHENWRWQPWYREMRRLIDAGRLGRPYHVSFLMRTGDGRGAEPYVVQPYFRRMPRLMIYETAVHFLDTFRFLLGEIESVYCRNEIVNPAIVGEDYSLVHVRFASGANGIIDANRISGPVPVPLTLGEMRLEGDRAAVRLSPDGALWLAEYPGPEKPHAFATTAQGYKGDSVKATQEHCLDCLSSGRRCESEGEEYLKTVAAVFACYRSAEEGGVVAP